MSIKGFSDPLHLYAETTVAPSSTGAPNTVALMNPSGGPMEIHEVRMSLRPGAGEELTGFLLDGGCVGLKLDMGAFPLTNGFVPFFCLGSGRYWIQEADDGQAASGWCMQFKWRLPFPLFVPGGAVVAPVFQHNGLVPKSLVCGVGYSARALPMNARAPSKVRLPYVAAYTSKGFDTFGAADSDQSSETDLVNKFDQPFNVTRFIGRVRGSSYTFMLESILNLRMVDSTGRQLMPRLTDWQALFDYDTKEFEAKFVLPPKAFVMAYLTKDQPASGATVDQDQSQAFIGMNGWREVGGK